MYYDSFDCEVTVEELRGFDTQTFEVEEEDWEDWDDEPSDWDLECGFDPYEGGYTWDC